MKFFSRAALALIFCAWGRHASGQVAAPMPVTHIQFSDVNGVPLAGGFVFTCVAGSACPGTPLVSYSNATGTANTNPVVLNAGGFGDFWLGTAPYKIVVQDLNGVQQYVMDNIPSTAALAASALNYTSPNAGAVQITVAAKLAQTLNFADLGGVCDGVTDMTAKLQTAVNGLTQGQTLTLPQTAQGCLLSSPGITLTNLQNVSLVGGTLLSMTASPIWSFLNLAGSTSNLTVRGVTFQGSATTGPTSGPVQCALLIPSTATGQILHFVDNTVSAVNVAVQNHADLFNFGDVHGNTISNTVDPARLTGYADIYSLGKHWHIYDNWFINSGFQGVYLSGDLAATGGGASYNTVEDNTFINSFATSITTYSTSAEAPATGNVFAHNHIFNPQNIAISCDGTATGCAIIGNDIQGASSTYSLQGIIQGASSAATGFGESNVVMGNTIKNSTGTSPLILFYGNNRLSITGNTLRNNPTNVPGILVSVYNTVAETTTGNTIAGNTISGGYANSIQGPGGTGVLTYTTVANNSLDGAIVNVIGAVADHNIVAGNGGPGNVNWAAVTPVSFGSNTAAKSQVDVFGNVSVGAYAGVTAAPANGAIISGQVGVGDPAPAAGTAFSVGGPSGGLAKANIGAAGSSSSALEMHGVPLTGYNALIGFQYNLSNTWEITPSTAVGGEIFTTPAFSVNVQTGIGKALNGFATGAGTGYSGTKTAGACVLTLSGGLIVNVTGC